MTRRLIAADVLKLVRRRGQMIWGLILTVGPIVIAYAVTAGYHLSDAAKNDAAGGAKNLENALWLILMLGGVAAAVLGTSAGIGDQTAGVFRELVVTGRSRLALFAARAPAALLGVPADGAGGLRRGGGLHVRARRRAADAVGGDDRDGRGSGFLAIASVQLLLAIGVPWSWASEPRRSACWSRGSWRCRRFCSRSTSWASSASSSRGPRSCGCSRWPASRSGSACPPAPPSPVLVLWTAVLLAAGARRTVLLDA